jgi:hypothetical protein
MKMKALAVIAAFVMIGGVFHTQGVVGAAEQVEPQVEQGATINIARIKSALKLTADQQRFWAPVEAALINISRQQARAEPDGVIKRIKYHAVAVVFDSAAIAQLAAAARPLVRVLDDEQKQTALVLAREMGFGWVLAKLN